MRIAWTIAVFCAATLAAPAADQPSPLLAFAAKGQTAAVESMLDRGAAIEAKDRDGRTPLMLAAQHGRVDTVRLLLDRGAKTDIRDREGYTAFMLATFLPAGHGDHEAAIQLLPKPPRLHVEVSVVSNLARLASSCFLNREQLAATVSAIRLDGKLLRQLADYAHLSGRGLLELVGENPEFTANIEVQPGAACSAQSGDNLTFNVDVRLVRAGDRQPVFQKSFGGGVKGLRVQTVNNAEQYGPVFDGWIKPLPESIYWAVAEAAYRYTPQQ